MFPPQWNQSGNTITYNPPVVGAKIVPVTGISNDSYDVFQFSVAPELQPIAYSSMLALRYGDGMLNLSLQTEASDDAEEDNEAAYTDYEQKTMSLTSNEGSEYIWNVVVRNALTGEVAFKGTVTGVSPSIPTVGWSSGIYAVSAEVDGIRLSGKVVIR